MKIDILSLFPDFIDSFINCSIIGRAVGEKIVQIGNINIRDFTKNKHKKVDDYPFGGGPGMVMTPEPIYEALMSVKKMNSKVIYLSPQGSVLSQKKAKELASEDHIILIAGHYEGIDNRIIENYVDEEISIGDFVLTGGEIPAMAVIDSIVRLLPGVLSSNESFEEESHYNGLLEHPQYTRPREFNGFEVPETLLSGNHKNIEAWKREKALENTYKKRPDLLKNISLGKEDVKTLNKIKNTCKPR